MNQIFSGLSNRLHLFYFRCCFPKNWFYHWKFFCLKKWPTKTLWIEQNCVHTRLINIIVVAINKFLIKPARIFVTGIVYCLLCVSLCAYVFHSLLLAWCISRYDIAHHELGYIAPCIMLSTMSADSWIKFTQWRSKNRERER